MPLISPIDHRGFSILEGYTGETVVTGTDADGKPWTTIYVHTTPISGSSDGSLHTVDKYALAFGIYRYQIGVDAGSYSNATTGSLVNVYGIPVLSASTLCPYVYNATDGTMHTVSLPSVTTSSFTVSPSITTASSSLVIRYNAAEFPYNSAAGAYQVYNLNPDYGHMNGPAVVVSESNGALGLQTSSDIPMAMYTAFSIQIDVLNNSACAISGTLDNNTSTIYWYPLTPEISTTGIYSCSFPVKYDRLRINYWKTNATNGTLVRYVLWSHGS